MIKILISDYTRVRARCTVYRTTEITTRISHSFIHSFIRTLFHHALGARLGRFRNYGDSTTDASNYFICFVSGFCFFIQYEVLDEIRNGDFCVGDNRDNAFFLLVEWKKIINAKRMRKQRGIIERR